MTPAVYTAEEVAELSTLSEWAVYQAAKRPDDPLGLIAVRVGRRLLFPKVHIDRLFGLTPTSEEVGP